jgi:hypothetical protein
MHNGLIIVLEYNNVHYKTNKSGNLLIKRKLSTDKEMLFNYTTKAQDSIWLNSHKMRIY